MNLCMECDKLTRMPLRSDVPASFERTLASDISSGLTRFIYQCMQCGDFWCWRAPDGWHRELSQPQQIAMCDSVGFDRATRRVGTANYA